MLVSLCIICALILCSSFVSGLRNFATAPKLRTRQTLATAPSMVHDESKGSLHAVDAPAVKIASGDLIGTESGKKYYPPGTSYCQCSVCKTAYLMDTETLGSKGLKIACGICKKDWYQTSERLLTTDDMNFLMPMPAVKVEEVKKILAEKNTPKYTRADKISIFVGNLPYKYTEEDIADLFAEYGLTSVALVRDAEQQSKGFAFIECSTMEDAEQLLQEMSGFYTEPNRRLTVNLTKAKGEGGGRGAQSSRSDDRRDSSSGSARSNQADAGDSRPSSGKSWSKAAGYKTAAASENT